MTTIMKSQPQFNHFLQLYADTAFEKWTVLNLEIEQKLMEASILIPLYYEKRQIPFQLI